MKLRKMTKCSLAMLLAMMMVCTLAVPAFAGTDADEITAVVSDSNNNHENEANNETENGDAVIENDDNKGGSEPSEEGNGDATDTDNDSDVEEHIHSYKADVNGMCGGPADITILVNADTAMKNMLMNLHMMRLLQNHWRLIVQRAVILFISVSAAAEFRPEMWLKHSVIVMKPL